MGEDKLWIDLAGRPLLERTLEAVAAAGLFDLVVVATAPVAWAAVRAAAERAGITAPLRLCAGGERRQDTVRLALAACPEADIVCVHDAARPLCPPALFGAVTAAAAASGAATAALPLADSVKRVDGEGTVVATVDRAGLVAVQTPQAFRRALLAEAHRHALAEGWVVDDDCALIERAGEPVVTVPGDPENLKVTTPRDLAVARRLIGSLIAPATGRVTR